MQKQVTENSKNRKTKEENTRKVSVVMTIYNGRKYLYEQLDSIAKQTRQPDEVIILDDKSSDDSVKVTLDFIAEHNIENWKVVQNETNLGWRANLFRRLYFSL